MSYFHHDIAGPNHPAVGSLNIEQIIDPRQGFGCSLKCPWENSNNQHKSTGRYVLI
ncbi:unnamed protein product [Schistosoma curassoni]|uniref:Uncharacterized protein n=1 Tax=Schistosoma curassoni TaxID=6186 RepID=A0A183JZQ9_9TREM|nr:unnamed protein product [Schistosoma curassoni]